jgi:hypothetical protein
MAEPEAWLRGPIRGVPDELLPVAHALLQAEEELERLLDRVPAATLWAAPGAAASAGYHVRHLIGSLDRLLTYARGDQLSDRQVQTLESEKEPDPGLTSADLLARAKTALELALHQVKQTDPATLGDAREVGRGRLPSTVRGLLFHAAEHTTRHVGQVSTTLKVWGIRS